MTKDSKNIINEEIQAKYHNGMKALILNITAMLSFLALFIYSIVQIAQTDREITADGPYATLIVLVVISAIISMGICPFIFAGLKVLAPNEALVLTFFGKYTGTLKGPGFYFVNPFSVAINPASTNATTAVFAAVSLTTDENKNNSKSINVNMSKKISLKAMTMANDKQKINDQLGNPIIIGIVVIWKVTNTAKAVFNVDNFKEFLSIQCDSALRNIVRLYPYDSANDNNEKSLRGSSDEISEKLKAAIQEKVEIAGLEIVEAKITHLSYAQEIAAAMLQRQQASAIVDARQMIVDGAVGMVEMALNRLNQSDIVDLDEERKAAMVSNLLVVLCGNKDAQPIVNSGSLY